MKYMSWIWLLPPMHWHATFLQNAELAPQWPCAHNSKAGVSPCHGASPTFPQWEASSFQAISVVSAFHLCIGSFPSVSTYRQMDTLRPLNIVMTEPCFRSSSLPSFKSDRPSYQTASWQFDYVLQNSSFEPKKSSSHLCGRPCPSGAPRRVDIFFRMYFSV